MLIRKIFFAAIMLVTCIISYAQEENCELTLVRATEEFESGHFYLIPSILNPCLNNFSQEQQLRANILLTQTYLLLDDPIGAKQSYLKILRADPEFEADDNIHPSDFVYLSKKFINNPVFAFFAKAGVNTTYVHLLHDIDVFSDDAVEKYEMRPGYQAAVGGDIYLTDKVGVRAEFTYTFLSYEHSTSNFFQDDRKTFVENQTWTTMPVSLMYAKPTGKYRPYVYGGFSANYLFRSVARGTIEKVRTSEGERDGQQSPDWDFLYKRNKWNYAVFAGFGLKVKTGLRYLFFDARYNMGLRNVVNPENLFTDNSLPMNSDEFIVSNSPTFSFAHVDDYFRLNNMSLSIGYLWPIYKPREMKPQRKKFLLMNLKQKK